MNPLIREIEQKYMKKDVPEFRPGDTVRVHVRIREQSRDEERQRVQAFEGVVIRRSGGGLTETMTVRRVTYGIGVERTFPIHAPVIDRIEVVRRGSTRRAKLHYLRGRSGRRSRIREDVGRTLEATTVEEMEAVEEELAEQTETLDDEQPAAEEDTGEETPRGEVSDETEEVEGETEGDEEEPDEDE